MALKFRWKDVLVLNEDEEYKHPYCEITSLKLLGSSGPAGDDYEIEGEFQTAYDVEKWIAELTDINIKFYDYINHYYEYDERHDFTISYWRWVKRCLNDYSDDDITFEDRMTCRQMQELEWSPHEIEFLWL